MIHDLAIHVATLVSDEAVKTVAGAALHPFAEILTRKVAKRFNLKSEAKIEIESMTVKMSRVEEALESMRLRLARIAFEGTDWDRVAHESREPSVDRFVDAAFDVAENTTLESKRLLVGVLIAQRLTVATDSDDEIVLRRALVTIENLTENQLRLLAAIVMVQDPPIAAGASPFVTRDVAEEYLRREYFGLADGLLQSLNFNESAFATLVSIGAIRLKDDTNALLLSDDVNPFDQWVQRNCGDVHEVLEGEWGSNESHEAYRKRFPTLTLLDALASGRGRGERFGRRLDSAILTPLGAMIGGLVFDQLLAARDVTAMSGSKEAPRL